MSKPFRVQLEIGSERREAELASENLGAAVEFCIDYARRNNGCKASVLVEVPASPIHSRIHTLFECSYPVLDDWMVAEITKHLGRFP